MSAYEEARERARKVIAAYWNESIALNVASYIQAADKEIATKDAELARLREALLEIAEHSGRTGEDAFVMADMALDAIRSKQ